jgi:hypothetical protein
MKNAEGVRFESVLRLACKQLATGFDRKNRTKRQLTDRQKELNFRSGGAEIFLDFLQSLASSENERAQVTKSCACRYHAPPNEELILYAIHRGRSA